MKTIGLLGGMSWQSTVPYYETINSVVAQELGGLNSAKIILHSVNFQEIVELQRENRWEQAGAILADAASGLRRAGADFLVLCVNTMHKVADQVERDSQLPLLHIIDTTVKHIKARGVASVGLLGTRYVVEGAFYRGRFEDEHGLAVLTPGEEDRQFVHDLIYNELSQGVLKESSRARCREIIAGMVARGAGGTVLACTELPLLLNSEDSPAPIFSTTHLHAREAALLAIGRG